MACTAAVITVSDPGSKGLRQDTSGPAVRAMLEDAGPQPDHQPARLGKAARENLSAVIGALEHAMHMIAAESHG